VTARAAALTLALTLAGALTPLAAGAAGGEIFRIAEPGTYIDSIDAALGDAAADGPLYSLVCASLTRLSDSPLPGGYRIVPELATSLPKASAGGTTYAFTIRKGLRFNTGAPVTAADVAFTIDRLLQLKSPSSGIFSGIVGAQAVVDGKAKHATGVVASGGKLTIRLLRPDGGFLQDVAASLCVVPEGLPFQPGGVTPPVPTAAPYYISEYVPGQQIVLSRNPYYGGSRPHRVDGFVFDLTVDENQALDEALDGKADYAWVPNPYYAARAPEFVRRFGVNGTRFFVQPSPFLRMFVFNTSRPLFKDNAPLRQAINYALDRAALIALNGSLGGTPVDDYEPPIFPDAPRTPIYPLVKPDLAKARSLARGHTRGGKLVLYVRNRASEPAIGQLVKQELAKIGLDVEIHVSPPAIHFQEIADPKTPFDMASIGWLNTPPDPSLFLNGLFDGGQIGTPGNEDYSYFNSPSWNAKLEAAARLTGEARYRAYAKLDVELARSEAPAAAYSVDNALTLVSARVGCVVANPYLDLADVCLK